MTLFERIAEARRLGLRGEAALRFVGVKLAGIDEAVVWRAAR